MSPVDIISWILLVSGSFFLVVGAIGIVRMPDVYTRMHAVSVAETLGFGLLIGGMMVQAGFTLVSFKLLCLFLLIFLTAPVASHAIARAALADGLKPILAGPEIDARVGDNLEPLEDLEDLEKITSPIDMSEAEASASVMIENVPAGSGNNKS